MKDASQEMHTFALVADIARFLQFLRRQIHFLTDNGRVAIFYIVLRFLAPVLFLSEWQSVRRELLLRYDSITDTIQFFLRARVQGGSNFLGRVQRAKIR